MDGSQEPCHLGTVGCRGCEQAILEERNLKTGQKVVRTHNEECRERFKKIFEDSEDPRLRREADRSRRQKALIKAKEGEGEMSSSSKESNEE